MAPDELLARLAVTLRKEVGPAVDGGFARTQAFMGAVVLEKIAAQLRLSAEHTKADERDRSALADDLDALLTASGPGFSNGVSDALRVALRDMHTDPTDAVLCRFVEGLYASRDSLGASTFEALLRRVRTSMRAAIDRRMEYSA